MIPSLFNGTVQPTACAPANIPMPSLFGAEFYSLEAHLVSNFSRYLPVGAYLNHGDVNITDVDFCNVTLSYTHPGQDDLLHVQAWLPIDTWNGRLQAIGGGGWRAGMSYSSSFSMQGAVGEGYVAITTDGGLGSSMSPADWGLVSPGNVNMYNLQNLASVSLNDMAVIGKSLAVGFYGQSPEYSYFNGCSQGGRQGLMLAQRYPDAFDGIAASAPAINWTKFFMTGLWPSSIMKKLGHVPPSCEYDAIRAAAIEACDGNDGVADGIISGECDFDPQSVIGRRLNCTNFGKVRKISSEAALIMQKTWEGPKDVDGKRIWFGLNKDVLVTGSTTDLPIVPTTCHDNGTCTAGEFSLASDWIKYFILRDADADLSDLTQGDFAGIVHMSVQQYESIIGTSDPDLSAFRNRGGKMVTYHGTSDSLIPVEGSIDYYQSVLELDENAPDFYRLFLAPGLRHCFGGSGPYPSSAFESMRKWTEEGVAPSILPASSVDTEPILHRNLCPFPKEPVYNGNADWTSAEAFDCA